MSRRRFTTEELEAMAVKDRLSREAKCSLLREVDALVRRGVFLAVCVFKCDEGKRELTRELQSLISVEEAANILRVDKSWIYRREDTLPFVVRLGEGTVRVCKRRLMEYIEQRISKSGDRSPPSGGAAS